MTPRAFLFDLDGTLVDLDVDIDAARAELAAMFAPLGYRRAFRPILARIDEAAAHGAPDAAERDRRRRSARTVLDRAERDAADRARARPGVAEALAAVAGELRGIVTDNGRPCVLPALAAGGLDAIGWDAAHIVTRDDVSIGKPDPEGVVRAATALLPDGGHLYWIGNSARDVGAGIAARDALPDMRITIVGVGPGDLVGADHVLPDLTGLIDLL